MDPQLHAVSAGLQLVTLQALYIANDTTSRESFWLSVLLACYLQLAWLSFLYQLRDGGYRQRSFQACWLSSCLLMWYAKVLVPLPAVSSLVESVACLWVRGFQLLVAPSIWYWAARASSKRRVAEAG